MIKKTSAVGFISTEKKVKNHTIHLNCTTSDRMATRVFFKNKSKGADTKPDLHNSPSC